MRRRRGKVDDNNNTANRGAATPALPDRNASPGRNRNLPRISKRTAHGRDAHGIQARRFLSPYGEGAITIRWSWSVVTSRPYWNALRGQCGEKALLFHGDVFIFQHGNRRLSQVDFLFRRGGARARVTASDYGSDVNNDRVRTRRIQHILLERDARCFSTLRHLRLRGKNEIKAGEQ